MTKEEKQLLFKELCARLPYHLYIRVEEFNVPQDDGRITEGFIGNYLKDNRCNDYDAESILNQLADGYIDVKLYLRTIYSMTEEEMDKLFDILHIDKDGDDEDWIKINNVLGIEFFFPTGKWAEDVIEAYDYLNSIHIDYRGLIEKDIALVAPVGMYETE